MRMLVIQGLTPCGPALAASNSPRRPSSPKRSYKDLFSVSDKTYSHTFLLEEPKQTLSDNAQINLLRLKIKLVQY